MFVHIPVPGGLPSGERAAAPSEKGFEKVAETAAEALLPCPGPTSRMTAARRRREIHAVFPARTELIILLAFFRVAEHLVGPEKRDRKSTRLNSSHVRISYAVFCLTK